MNPTPLHRHTPRANRWLRLLAAFALVVFASGALTACETDTPDQAAHVDHLPALVAMAESYHIEADVAVERDDLDAAAEAMVELTHELEPYAANSEDVRILGLDAYTRLARIRLDQGRPQDALAVADSGLALGAATADHSIFGGYLHQTRGNIQIALGDDLGGVESHRAAILVFKKILEANDAAREAAPGGDAE